MITNNRLLLYAALICGLTFSTLVRAQSVLNAYPTGAEGIRPGTVAPPGHYTKLYNLFYWADDFNNANGQSLDPNFEAFTYLGAIRHFWITEYEFLGANYGMDFALPFVHNDVNFSTPGGVAGQTSAGLGDILFQPLLLGWHGDQWDLGLIYGMFIPTGDFDVADLSSPGSGQFTQLIGLGVTWYLDSEKTWSLATAQRIEFHSHNDDRNITAGNHYSMEWALAKKLPDLWEVGAVGTITQKVSDDTGSGVFYPAGTHDRVYSAGAEVTKFFPEKNIQASLRWFHEFEAEARPQGDAIWFSLSKIW